jgi:hypothetical protein
VTFLWDLTQEIIHLLLGCLKGGVCAPYGGTTFVEQNPLWSELGKYKTVTATFWPWLEPFRVRKPLKLSTVYAIEAGVRHGKAQRPPRQDR